eukprot:TRINITY_DN6756_c0_g2_i2.p1 TRINITY_DN6756_c0_g2~~TRINITY_DN6756_c0_g2_i2.p1  ORF type:complete len:594 (-),score=73.71 TRINITY_DN6756_c0_g2_i2:203-1984(-)
MVAMSLGGMLLFNLIWTAGSERIDMGSLLGTKVGHPDAQRLCTSSVVETGCDALGVSPDGETALASAQQLAEALAASIEDVNALLHTVLGNDNLINSEFVIQQFCEQAVLKTPSILGMAAPQNPGLGCVNAECDHGSIDITEETLSQLDLATIPPPNETDTNRAQDIGLIQPDDPALRRQTLFRSALNVVFGIFPAVDEDADELTNSLLQEQTGPERPGADVAFGPRIRRDRHSKYRASALKASAWISTALRRIRYGRDVTKKWFILRSEAQIDAQIIEARKHLTKMLTAIGHLKLKKGPSRECPVTDKGSSSEGVLAYVWTKIGCSVQSTNSCEGGRSCSSCGGKEQGRYVMNICEFYWEFGEATRTGTLVHEASHHFGTDDKKYCESGGCLSLSSVKARNNADSYTYFVKELVTSPSLQRKTPGNRKTPANIPANVPANVSPVPHPTCNTGCNPNEFQGPTQLWHVKHALPLGSCGRCEEVRNVHVGRLRVWGDDCEHGYQKAKSAQTRMLCCKPYQCEAPTTTTSTTSTLAASCPYPARLSRSRSELCKCPRTHVCRTNRRRHHGKCGYSDDRVFRQSCNTCACRRQQKK